VYSWEMMSLTSVTKTSSGSYSYSFPRCLGKPIASTELKFEIMTTYIRRAHSNNTRKTNPLF